jgi:hypothetical protein
MPRNILRRYSADLAKWTESADDAAKRSVVFAVCTWAVARTLPNDPLVQSALGALEKSSSGDQALMDGLKEHVSDLDRAYFDTRDAGGDFFPLFVKARVANAVYHALDTDPLYAVTHSLYELCASLGTDLVETEVNRAVGAPPAIR